MHEWAAANELLVLHPRASDGPRNEGGCWDWDGQTGERFDTHAGGQLRTVINMVEFFGAKSVEALERDAELKEALGLRAVEPTLYLEDTRASQGAKSGEGGAAPPKAELGAKALEALERDADLADDLAELQEALQLHEEEPRLNLEDTRASQGVMQGEGGAAPKVGAEPRLYLEDTRASQGAAQGEGRAATPKAELAGHSAGGGSVSASL